MVKTNRKAKTNKRTREATRNAMVREVAALTVDPERRLACCVASPERDTVLKRIMVELEDWPTYHLIHLLPALAVHTGSRGIRSGDVSVIVADDSLYSKLEELDRTESR